MKCKFCGAQLEDEVTLCPECGKDNAKNSLDVLQKKVKTMQIALGVLVAVVLLAALVFAIVYFVGEGMLPGATESTQATKPAATVPTDGNPDDETCKGSYTVTDDVLSANRDAVIATMGEEKLTNGVFQVYYWNAVYDFLSQYSSAISYFGLDITQPMDSQACTVFEEPMTWQQCFVRQALNTWQTYQSMAIEAKKNDYVMSDYYQSALNDLKKTLEETAEKNKFESVEAMLAADYGTGCTFEEYYAYMELSYYAGSYYQHLQETLDISDDAIQAYFKENAESLKSQYKIEAMDTDLTSIRHILIIPEGGKTDSTGNTTYTEAEWEACRIKAQAIYDKWLAGDKTESSFSDLAKENSKDGNASEGGIYDDVYPGQMATEFNGWCFDEARQPGDHGLVKTPYGYHIMYFVKAYEGTHPVVLSGARREALEELLEQLEKDLPADVTYKSIVVGNVKLS